MFKNDISQGSTINSNPIDITGGDVMIGYGFNGLIDEVQISGLQYDVNLPTWGVYTSDVIDLNSDNPIFDSLSWEEYSVRTGDGETLESDQSLVAHWKFNETSGTTVSDSSGNGHNGTATNMTTSGQDDYAVSGWTADNRKWGAGAIMFDGGNDYIQVSDHNDFDFGTGAFSISSWIKTEDKADYQAIVYHHYNPGYSLLTNITNGVLRFWVGNSVLNGVTSVTDGQWHMVTATRDNSSNVRLYVDGKLDNSGTGYTGNADSTEPVGIGRYVGGLSSYPFNGVLDSTRLYSRALDADEILSNYQIGQIEIQTRTGSDTTPNDGSWEAWMPSDLSVATQLLDLDSDQTNWSFDQTVDSLTKADESNIKIENSGSMRVTLGQLTADANTVGLWHLDETAGTSSYLKDSSGNGNHATPTGTTLVDGKSRYARSLNGTSDYILVSNSSELNFVSQPYTIESWIKLSSGLTGNVYRRVVDKTQAGTGNGYGFDIKDYSDIRMLGNTILNGSYSFSPDQWYHVSTVSDGSGSGYIYVNGELVISGPYDSDNAWTGTLQMGKASDTTSYFGGTIDEVRISDVARTPEEIAENYRLGASHYLTRSLASAKDLSSNNRLSYYIASDSPGTHINTTAGESPYANYQPDANTAGLWHLDETDSNNESNDVIKFTSTNIAATNAYTYWKAFAGQSTVVNTNDTIEYDVYIETPQAGIGVFDIKFTDASYLRSYASSANANLTNVAYYKWYHRSLSVPSAVNGKTIDWVDLVNEYDSNIVTTAYYDNFVVKNSSGAIKKVLYSSGSPGFNVVDFRSNSSNTGSATRVDKAWPMEILHDSSIYGNNAISEETVTTTGKIGKARYFDGVNDFIQTNNTSSFADFSVEAWIKPDTDSSIYRAVISKAQFSGSPWNFRIIIAPTTGIIRGEVNDSVNSVIVSSPMSVLDNKWHHIVYSRDASGNVVKLYVDGQLVDSDTDSTTGAEQNSQEIWIGKSPYNGGNYPFKGSIDEVRISDIVRTPEEIRQAYEVGKRTHDVTIDFAADLDSGNLITGSGDTSFTIDATAYGLSQKGANLFPGDKVIVRENYNGTEYIAQGDVTAVNKSTGAVTVNNWDTGGTFPTSGYTANADVFKWQREYFDISGAMSSHINAVDEISFQFLDGNAGRTFWIDDIHMIENDGYLTDETGVSVPSTPARYFQYRAIMTTTDPDPTPALGPVTLDYTEGDITMTAASTSESYMNTENNSAFNVQCNGVSYAPSGDTVTCYGSWNQTNWFAINTATSPLSSVTIQDNENVAGWTGYPLGNGTFTIYARAGVNGNYSDTKSFSIEKDVSRPSVLSITSVAGDTSATYYDTTDDSSTTVIYTADTDASSCKWDETDLTYGAMTNMCGSTTSCTLDLSGEEEKTIYMRCVDTAGNYSDSSYQLDYTIDATPPAVTSITSVAGDTSSPYKDGTDNSSTAVVYSASTDAVSCKWDESDLTYTSMANTCSSTSSCTLNVAGEGAQTVYMRCIDNASLVSTSSYQLNYTIDTTPPNVDTITSVAGDTATTYYDTTDDSSTLIIYTTDAIDTTACKWDESDLTYGAMANTCTSTTNCTTDLSGDGDKTVYMRCIDDLSNASTNSYILNYTIDSTPPEVTAITSVAGDTAVTYYDNTDDGSTAVIYTASADAVSCKWDESDLTYGTMASTCTDTSNCDLDLAGEGSQTVYMRCLDAAGLASSSSYQLDYTIDTTPPSISTVNSVDGDTSAPYYDTTDDSSTIINFTSSTDTTDCKWDESDITYSAMANTCTDDSNCDVDLAGEGSHAIYIRCIDEANNPMTVSEQVDYTIDTTPPVVSSITSVAGDTSDPYKDGTDNGSTAVVLVTSADSSACKWNETDEFSKYNFQTNHKVTTQ